MLASFGIFLTMLPPRSGMPDRLLCFLGIDLSSIGSEESRWGLTATDFLLEVVRSLIGVEWSGIVDNWSGWDFVFIGLFSPAGLQGPTDTVLSVLAFAFDTTIGLDSKLFLMFRGSFCFKNLDNFVSWLGKWDWLLFCIVWLVFVGVLATTEWLFLTGSFLYKELNNGSWSLLSVVRYLPGGKHWFDVGSYNWAFFLYYSTRRMR